MKTVTKGGVTSVVAQNEVIIPDLTIKDLLSALPSVRHSLSSLSALPADIPPFAQSTLLQAFGTSLLALYVSSPLRVAASCT
jgi:hypothetical protein